MDCQLFHVIFRNKIKVMKREAWASQTTTTSNFVCWPCTMLVSRHSYEEPSKRPAPTLVLRSPYPLSPARHYCLSTKSSRANQPSGPYATSRKTIRSCMLSLPGRYSNLPWKSCHLLPWAEFALYICTRSHSTSSCLLRGSTCR